MGIESSARRDRTNSLSGRRAESGLKDFVEVIEFWIQGRQVAHDVAIDDADSPAWSRDLKLHELHSVLPKIAARAGVREDPSRLPIISRNEPDRQRCWACSPTRKRSSAGKGRASVLQDRKGRQRL